MALISRVAEFVFRLFVGFAHPLPELGDRTHQVSFQNDQVSQFSALKCGSRALQGAACTHVAVMAALSYLNGEVETQDQRDRILLRSAWRFMSHAYHPPLVQLDPPDLEVDYTAEKTHLQEQISNRLSMGDDRLELAARALSRRFQTVDEAITTGYGEVMSLLNQEDVGEPREIEGELSCSALNRVNAREVFTRFLTRFKDYSTRSKEGGVLTIGAGSYALNIEKDPHTSEIREVFFYDSHGEWVYWGKWGAVSQFWRRGDEESEEALISRVVDFLLSLSPFLKSSCRLAVVWKKED